MSSVEGNASRNGTDEYIQTSIHFLKHLMDLFHSMFSISAWLHLNPLKLFNSELESMNVEVYVLKAVHW